MPTFLDMSRVTIADYGVLAVIVASVSYVVLGTYAAVAHRARGLTASPIMTRRVNQATGGTLIGAGIVIAAR